MFPCVSCFVSFANDNPDASWGCTLHTYFLVGSMHKALPVVSQSINQSINQPNQTVHQPNRSTSQSIIQPINSSLPSPLTLPTPYPLPPPPLPTIVCARLLHRRRLSCPVLPCSPPHCSAFTGSPGHYPKVWLRRGQGKGNRSCRNCARSHPSPGQ